MDQLNTTYGNVKQLVRFIALLQTLHLNILIYNTKQLIYHHISN